MSNEETRYRFECECNGEIPIGEGPTLSETKKALADYCRDANRSPAKALAELAAELMLSGEVYGPEFVQEADAALFEKKPGA